MSGIGGLDGHYDPSKIYGNQGVQGPDGTGKTEGKGQTEDKIFYVTEARSKVSFAIATPELAGAMNLTPEERQEYLLAIQAKATSAMMSLGRKSVMLDIYSVLELIRKTSQQLRNAMREMRQAENTAIQANIKNQAATQRRAAVFQMIGGAVVGLIQAGVSVGGFVQQVKSLNRQQMANKLAGVDMAEDQLKLAQCGGDPTSADKSLAKVKSSKGMTPAIVQEVEKKMTPGAATAGDRMDAAVTELKKLDGQKNVSVSLGKEIAVASMEGDEAKAEAFVKADLEALDSQILEQRTAADKAHEAYCKAIGAEPPKESDTISATGAQLDKKAATLEQLKGIKAEMRREIDATDDVPKKQRLWGECHKIDEKIEHATLELKDAKAAYDSALGKAKRLEPAAEQKAVQKTLGDAVNEYKAAYERELAEANKGHRLDGVLGNEAKLEDAANRYKLARAIQVSETSKLEGVTQADHLALENELSGDLDVRTTKANAMMKNIAHERHMAYGTLAQQLAQNIGQIGQQAVSSISQIMQTEATEEQADQKQLEEELDQIKDLFQEDQALIQKAMELFQSVVSKETQSLDEIINALKA